MTWLLVAHILIDDINQTVVAVKHELHKQWVNQTDTLSECVLEGDSDEAQYEKPPDTIQLDVKYKQFLANLILVLLNPSQALEPWIILNFAFAVNNLCVLLTLHFQLIVLFKLVDFSGKGPVKLVRLNPVFGYYLS